MWYATLPQEEWPEEEDARAQIQGDWEEPWGDRRQELVIIGVDLEEAALGAKLDAALLTKNELDAGAKGWSKLRDPFPAWTVDEVAA